MDQGFNGILLIVFIIVIVIILVIVFLSAYFSISHTTNASKTTINQTHNTISGTDNLETETDNIETEYNMETETDNIETDNMMSETETDNMETETDNIEAEYNMETETENMGTDNIGTEYNMESETDNTETDNIGVEYNMETETDNMGAEYNMETETDNMETNDNMETETENVEIEYDIEERITESRGIIGEITNVINKTNKGFESKKTIDNRQEKNKSEYLNDKLPGEMKNCVKTELDHLFTQYYCPDTNLLYLYGFNKSDYVKYIKMDLTSKKIYIVYKDIHNLKNTEYDDNGQMIDIPIYGTYSAITSPVIFSTKCKDGANVSVFIDNISMDIQPKNKCLSQTGKYQFVDEDKAITYNYNVSTNIIKDVNHNIIYKPDSSVIIADNIKITTSGLFGTIVIYDSKGTYEVTIQMSPIENAPIILFNSSIIPFLREKSGCTFSKKYPNCLSINVNDYTEMISPKFRNLHGKYKYTCCDDSDCDDGRCVNGVCTNVPCDSDLDCPLWGTVCDTDTKKCKPYKAHLKALACNCDKDCVLPNYKCVNNMCAEDISKKYIPCKNNSDCDSLNCVYGMCNPQNVKADQKLLSCSPRSCPNGVIIDGKCVDRDLSSMDPGTQLYRNNDVLCLSDANCLNGAKCLNGRCFKGCTNQSECGPNKLCHKGKCLAGKPTINNCETIAKHLGINYASGVCPKDQVCTIRNDQLSVLLTQPDLKNNNRDLNSLQKNYCRYSNGSDSLEKPLKKCEQQSDCDDVNILYFDSICDEKTKKCTAGEILGNKPNASNVSDDVLLPTNKCNSNADCGNEFLKCNTSTGQCIIDESNEKYINWGNDKNSEYYGPTPKQITDMRITNHCGYDIHLEARQGSRQVPLDGCSGNTSDYKLSPGQSMDFDYSQYGTDAGIFFAKFGCDDSGNNCLIGNSLPMLGTNECPQPGCQPPLETRGEVTSGCAPGVNANACTINPSSAGGKLPLGSDTYFDVSGVDGYSFPYRVWFKDHEDKLLHSTPDNKKQLVQSALLDGSNLTLDKCPSKEDLTWTQEKYNSIRKKVDTVSGPDSVGGSNYCKIPPQNPVGYTSAGENDKWPWNNYSNIKDKFEKHNKTFTRNYDDLLKTFGSDDKIPKAYLPFQQSYDGPITNIDIDKPLSKCNIDSVDLNYYDDSGEFKLACSSPCKKLTDVPPFGLGVYDASYYPAASYCCPLGRNQSGMQGCLDNPDCVTNLQCRCGPAPYTEYSDAIHKNTKAYSYAYDDQMGQVFFPAKTVKTEIEFCPVKGNPYPLKVSGEKKSNLQKNCEVPNIGKRVGPGRPYGSLNTRTGKYDSASGYTTITLKDTLVNNGKTNVPGFDSVPYPPFKLNESNEKKSQKIKEIKDKLGIKFLK